jgi:hypothetical protein
VSVASVVASSGVGVGAGVTGEPCVAPAVGVLTFGSVFGLAAWSPSVAAAGWRPAAAWSPAGASTCAAAGCAARARAGLLGFESPVRAA